RACSRLPAAFQFRLAAKQVAREFKFILLMDVPTCWSRAMDLGPAFARISPRMCSRSAGYYIWRGAPNESDLSPETRKTVFPYYSFFLADQLQALGYPIAGADDELRIGHRRYNWAWYRVATARLIGAGIVNPTKRL